MPNYKIKTKHLKFKARKVFLTKGTCSYTFFYLLNREFGLPMPEEERAIDPLAGGILQLGYQCGMLWGASIAAGAEAYRRYPDTGTAAAEGLSNNQTDIQKHDVSCASELIKKMGGSKKEINCN